MSRVRVEESLAKDPNYIEYMRLKGSGYFDNLPKGAYIKIVEGVYVAWAPTEAKIIELGPKDKGGFIKQPNEPEVVYRIPSIFGYERSLNLFEKIVVDIKAFFHKKRRIH